MAAATLARTNQYDIIGNKTSVCATLTSPTNGQTWDTGLRVVDHVNLIIVESTGAAADGIHVGSISAGIVTLGVEGTVDSALAYAEGV